MRHLLILGVALLGLVAGPARAADDALPALTEEQRAALKAGLQTGASYGDPAFDALLAHTRSWGRLMLRWAATPDSAPAPLTPAEIIGLAETGGAPGEPVVIFGEFLEREPVAKYANLERWLIAPLDPENPGVRADRAAIVFVDRTTSAAFSLPRQGWYVRVAGRFYKPLMLPRRTTGEEVAYPSFVGASFEARQKLGDPPSGLFAFVGLGVAIMFAAMIVLVVVVSKVRSRPTRFEAARSAGRAPAPPADSEPGLPGDPAEAMKHLADRADSTDKDSHG